MENKEDSYLQNIIELGFEVVLVEVEPQIITLQNKNLELKIPYTNAGSETKENLFAELLVKIPLNYKNETILKQLKEILQ